MNASKNIAKRVNELIDKYSNSPNSVQYLLCDQYPPNKLAYKIINENIAEKIISPNEGDIVIIPSSLFHQAIAYYSDENRECIAFDVIPN